MIAGLGLFSTKLIRLWSFALSIISREPWERKKMPGLGGPGGRKVWEERPLAHRADFHRRREDSRRFDHGEDIRRKSEPS
ncbi:hypothetical protein XI09_02555 [Bradyrhizobium sp. CCBAU 11386]|nr:hypothetical protein [Bradyrhizobium sp. CCBAU 11386]